MDGSTVILFFDSGIGGLTTLYECYKLLPNERYFYYADKNNMPYGEKDVNNLKDKIIKKLSFLICQHNPQIVVIACNTATSLVVVKMRMLYPKIIFIGTEPAIIPAIREGKKHILLLATKNTINNNRLYKLVSNYHDIMAFSPPNFATIIENNINNTDYVCSFLSKHLVQFVGCCDCVVLGCTHYVFFKKQIKNILGVKAYDGNFGVAKRLKSLLDLFKLHSFDGCIKFLNTGKLYTRLVNTFELLKRGK